MSDASAETDSKSPGATLLSAARKALGFRILWVLLLPLGVLYGLSFRNYGIIDRKHSVLADADASNFKMLVEEFGFRRRLGNEYNAINRGIGDNAEKHKIHHVLYAMVAHPIYLTARSVERLAGGSGNRAAYDVNAVITCLNLVLLALLLRAGGSTAPAALPFLGVYAFSLSTWLYASVPESWPFSASLVLIFLLVLERWRLPLFGLAALIGLFMLNNFALGALFLLLGLRILADEPGVWVACRRAVGAGLVTLAIWLGCLTVLGVFDESLRPDRFFHFTLWFRQYVAAGLPPWALYVWKSVLSNLFVNSLASHQGDPSVPQEALKLTLQSGSVLGVVSLVSVLALLGLTGARFASRLGNAWRSGGWRNAVRTETTVIPGVWALTMVVVTIVLYYGSGFLYSAVVVPVVLLVAGRVLDLRRPADRWIVYGTLIAVVANNVSQVLIFRAALLAAS